MKNFGFIATIFLAFSFVGCSSGKKLTEEEVDILTRLYKNIQKRQTQRFTGRDEELKAYVDAFVVCNTKIYPYHSEQAEITRSLIQDKLYSYVGFIEDNSYYNTVHFAMANPALGLEVSPIFELLASPTLTQKKVLRDNYDTFIGGARKQLEDYSTKLIEEKKSFANLPIEERRQKGLILVSPFICSEADSYLGLFDYSLVGEFKTLSRTSAAEMIRSSSSQSRIKAIEQFNKLPNN
ncbi:hypothetical protein [Pseudoalteromonas sp. T1lg22]|uniref:hypothetical protein n=1 Tax=Pseudoalteromonas sp. T1lg22 TaxID=2077096 RepID=UPI00131A45D5|nr:hypothetical protein [Pseudoalteromonas sp. T1lg22]